MNHSELQQLRELTLLIDLAHHYQFEKQTSGKYTSAEASIRLEFGNFWYRQKNQPEQPGPPLIEQVVIYSSVFVAGRVGYFDSLVDAIEAARAWLEQVRGSEAA